MTSMDKARMAVQLAVNASRQQGLLDAESIAMQHGAKSVAESIRQYRLTLSRQQSAEEKEQSNEQVTRR